MIPCGPTGGRAPNHESHDHATGDARSWLALVHSAVGQRDGTCSGGLATSV